MSESHNHYRRKLSTNPRASHRWKWYILLLTCCITLGGYYSFDFPSALHGQLFRHFSTKNHNLILRDFEYQFGLAYSVYSLPNMVLPWLGGIGVDRIGNNTVMILAGTLVLLGNLIQTTAVFTFSMPLFLFGRFVFGLGAETLTVTANTYIAKWFHGQELAFALGVNLSACKLGGVLTAWGSPYIARNYSVKLASISVSLLCLFSFGVSLLLYMQEPWYHPPHFEHGVEYPSDKSESIPQTVPKQQQLTSSSLYQTVDSHYDGSVQNNINSSEQKNRNGYLTLIQSETLDQTYHSNNKINNSNKHNLNNMSTYNTLHISNDINHHSLHNSSSKNESSAVSEKNSNEGCYMHFKQSVWLVFLLTFIMYGTFIPFSNISNAVILEVFFPADVAPGSAEYQANEVKAAQLQSIPYFLTVFINPLLGLAIDYFGYRTLLLLFACGTLVTAHLLIYTSSIGAVAPLLMIGVSFSVFGSVSWPCVPLIVSETHHGTAYGLMGAFQNAAQTLVPLILSQTYHDTESYRACELVLAGFASLGMLVGGYLWYVDEYHEQGILRKP